MSETRLVKHRFTGDLLVGTEFYLASDVDALLRQREEQVKALCCQNGALMIKSHDLKQQLAAAQDRVKQLETAIVKAASAPGYNWLHEQLELAKALTPTERPPA